MKLSKNNNYLVKGCDVMNLSCDNCNLNHIIGQVRERLENIIIEKNHNLLDEQVINISQLLDDLVFKCVFCGKNINNSSELPMNNKLNLKLDPSFQYLENNHFFISIYFYMFEGIKNNQMIYISMDECLYHELLNILNINSIPTEYIQFRSIKELIISNKTGGLVGLEEKIKDISLEDQVKNYDGIRWISQPTYAIKNTSINDFLDWEMNLNQALKKVDSSLGYIYSNYNYIEEDKYIQEPVINTSLNSNTYILNDLKFVGVEYKF